MTDKKVILLTGASSGIGYQTARLLAEKGFQVYGAARRLDQMAALKKFGVIPLKLDLTDETSIASVVSQIIHIEGHIDILINNAGYGSFGAIENVSMQEARRQFDVNLFGLARLVQLVLPYMRSQKSGRIINVSSMAGRMTTFMGAWYHAAKYALEAFSDALRMETKTFGIQVVLIEPGAIKTDWGTIAAQHLSQSSQGTVYQAEARMTAKKMISLYTSNWPSKADLISNIIVKSVTKKRPKTRYLVGFGAKPIVFLHAILPSPVFDGLIKRIF